MERQYFKQFIKASLIGSYILLSMAVGAQNHTPDQRKKQGPPPLPTEEQIEQRVAKLTTELKLSDSQKQEVSHLFTAHYNELRVKREEEKKQRELHRKEMEAFRVKFEQEVKAVLTPEQQQKFDELRKEHKPRHKEGKEQQ